MAEVPHSAQESPDSKQHLPDSRDHALVQGGAHIRARGPERAGPGAAGTRSNEVALTECVQTPHVSQPFEFGASVTPVLQRSKPRHGHIKYLTAVLIPS